MPRGGPSHRMFGPRGGPLHRTFGPRGGLLLLLVFGLWIAAILLVGVGGEFPLSDDWAYAHVVRSLAEGRGFDLLPWTGASVVFQAAYGALVTQLAGFSYGTLRLTTLLVSAIGIASSYGLAREAGAGTRVAAAAAATVAFSPLWFNLSFTFMTDVPFAALATLSAWLYARAFRLESRSMLAAAGVVAAAAFLVRQHGIWIAAAAGLASLAAGVRARRPMREWVLDAAAAAVVPGLTAAAYVAWTMTSDVVPLALHNKIDEAAGITAAKLANATFRGIATLGFFLLPWAALAWPASRRGRAAFLAAFGVLAATALFLYAREGASMFYLSNMLGDFWIGPWTTRDVQFLARPVPDAGPAFHLVLTAASLAAAALLVSRAFEPSPPAPVAPAVRMFCVLAFALSALGTLAQAHYYFDRYLIVLVPLAIAALPPPPRVRARFVALLGVLAFYAIAGTHDYMEWNRGRWELLASLEARGVSARSIDGGVEYNGERLAAVLGTSPTDAQARRGQSPSVKSWWWVVDDQWVVATAPLDGYRLSDSRTFTRWLPPGEGRVLLLERSGAPAGDSKESG